LPRPIVLKLKSAPLPDVFTLSKYRVSPYIGCAHACAYCDGRAEKYFVEGEFSDARTKPSYQAGLGYEFSGIREKGLISFGSGITDIYQPKEAEEAHVPRLIEATKKSGMPAMFITKGSLMLRDLELWKPIARGPGLLVYITITSVDQNITDVFEPNAAPLDLRFEAVKAFTAIGAAVGVLALPLLPGLTDDKQTVFQIAKRAKDNGAAFCMPGGLTLRPGRQKEHFLKAVEEHFPHLLATYREVYHEDRLSGMPFLAYRNGIGKKWDEAAREAGLPLTCPHESFKGKVSVADEIFLVLCRAQEAYRNKGLDTSRLKTAVDAFVRYLTEKKSYFNRRKSLDETWMDDQLRFDLQTGVLGRIINNEKTSDFIEKICLQNKIFDFLTLKFKDK
jgi:DNA repair photolyase